MIFPNWLLGLPPSIRVRTPERRQSSQANLVPNRDKRWYGKSAERNLSIFSEISVQIRILLIWYLLLWWKSTPRSQKYWYWTIWTHFIQEFGVFCFQSFTGLHRRFAPARVWSLPEYFYKNKRVLEVPNIPKKNMRDACFDLRKSFLYVSCTNFLALRHVVRPRHNKFSREIGLDGSNIFFRDVQHHP